MSVRQTTLGSEATFEGVGLHTGEAARLRFLPAEPGQGLRFRRTDLDSAPDVVADLEHVTSTDRGTTLGEGEAVVHTVEHLLAAAMALRVDNMVVEIDGPEVPIADGSFEPFLRVLAGAGARELDEAARVIRLSGNVTAAGPAGAAYVGMPADRLRVSAGIEFDHPLVRRQFASFDVDPEGFEEEVAPARTFGFLREAEELRARGLALGATLENAIVLDDEGLASGELRFPDEFVRHKIGDVVGDLALLGARVEAHIMADRPSHAGNLALARAIRTSHAASRHDIDIQRIMEVLPHRYPMLLVDRILEFEREKRVVGIKNVTINEPFFQGHFPGHAVMPGVLIIEAMAQCGGLLLMDSVDDPDDKIVYFMSLDKVKWRRPVRPGDQLRFELEMLHLRRQVCRMRGTASVDGQPVAEAEMMARIMDR
ncbi:MAG: bifunctional UDP-3-O-[3-hydroxymyristoyl] N-acetylglucosamine deacetylase/3-hydroxyacyl-ACP dehydratase [Gemmatimonadota bacterium]